METITSETIFDADVETPGQDNECLIPINEYGQRLGVSRRTLYRYAKVGRIKTKKHIGRTYVVDKPLKPAPVKTDIVRHDQTSELALPVEKDWFAFGMAKSQATARRKWQFACRTFVALFVVALIASVWLFQERQIQLGMIEGLQSQLNTAAVRGIATAAEVQELEQQLSMASVDLGAQQARHTTELEALRLSHAAAVGRLQDQIGTLTGQIVELSRQKDAMEAVEKLVPMGGQ